MEGRNYDDHNFTDLKKKKQRKVQRGYSTSTIEANNLFQLTNEQEFKS